MKYSNSQKKLYKKTAMSSITRKILSTYHDFSEIKWFYNFRELTRVFDDKICANNAARMFQEYSKITNDWSEDTNSEWLCRIYFSAKMVFQATLQLMSLEFAIEKNLRVVTSYLEYYAIFSACRCVAATLPNIPWADGRLFSMDHSKVINITFDHLGHFDKNISREFKEKVLFKKACRELISYKAPSSGDYGLDNAFDIQELCTLLVELGQFNSEILEKSIIKNADKNNFKFKQKYIDELSRIKIGENIFRDDEDWYRLDYLRRKWPMPPNILHIMTEGHTEDFFGAWEPKEDYEIDDDIFPTGPSYNWRIIFDIP